MRKLVAYFSVTGTTNNLAERLAKSIDAELFEIVPKEPYTMADLDWTNKNSRSTVEMKNANFRPQISNKLQNMAEYDTVFVGFPIWWYVAPTIINTFLEQYDLTGKTIVPFATSGGSGMGKTNDALKNSCKNAVLKQGKVFQSNASIEELEKWVESIK